MRKMAKKTGTPVTEIVPAVLVIWQTKAEYPTVNLMITNNPKCIEGKLVVRSKDDLFHRLEAWLDKYKM